MDVTEQTFNDEVIQRSYDTPVVVDFWAAWCAPCRQLAPLIESVVARRDGEVLLAKVDIDANPALAQKYRIQSIPAVRAFRDGEIVGSFDGLIPSPAIEAFFNSIVIADGRTDQALVFLKPASHDHGAQGLISRIALMTADNPDIAAGLAALDREDREAALTHLLDAIRTTNGDIRDQVRQTMVGVFNELGDHHPLTAKYRRRLAQALY